MEYPTHSVWHGAWAPIHVMGLQVAGCGRATGGGAHYLGTRPGLVPDHDTPCIHSSPVSLHHATHPPTSTPTPNPHPAPPLQAWTRAASTPT